MHWRGVPCAALVTKRVCERWMAAQRACGARMRPVHSASEFAMPTTHTSAIMRSTAVASVTGSASRGEYRQYRWGRYSRRLQQSGSVVRLPHSWSVCEQHRCESAMLTKRGAGNGYQESKGGGRQGGRRGEKIVSGCCARTIALSDTMPSQSPEGPAVVPPANSDPALEQHHKRREPPRRSAAAASRTVPALCSPRQRRRRRRRRPSR